MVTQFELDAAIASQIDSLKQNIIDQKKAGVLVIIDGSDDSAAAAYIGKRAVERLNEHKSSYSFVPYLLADEHYSKEARYELVHQLELLLPVELNIDDALDELVLEAEYMYKKLGVSRHMSIKNKQQLRYKLSYHAAEAMASDLNLLLYLKASNSEQ